MTLKNIRVTSTLADQMWRAPDETAACIMHTTMYHEEILFVAEVPEPWWICIERDTTPDLYVGPYPTQQMVNKALDDAVLIQGLLEEPEGGIDCYTTNEDPGDLPLDQFVLVNLADPDHVG